MKTWSYIDFKLKGSTDVVKPLKDFEKRLNNNLAHFLGNIELNALDIFGSGYTANRLTQSNGSEKLTSVIDINDFIYGTTYQIEVTSYTSVGTAQVEFPDLVKIPSAQIGDASNYTSISNTGDISFTGTAGIDMTYGGIYSNTSPEIVADSYTEVSGATIVSGTVTDTRTIDQTYLQVEEDQKFDIQFTFSGLSGNVSKIVFAGRYEGNPAHNVFLYQYNYTTTSWVRVTSASQDFPSSSTDYMLDFVALTGSDYVSAGETKVRIYHDSVAVGSHDIYIDYIGVLDTDLTLTTAGDYYTLSGLSDADTNNVTVDGSNGTITIDKTGVYDHSVSASFTGLEDSIVKCAYFVNGTIENDIFIRKLNASGDVGVTSAKNIHSFTSGDVVSYRFESGTPNSFLSFYNFSAMVIRIN